MIKNPANPAGRDEPLNLRKNISKATMLLTGTGPPIHKQIKTAILEGNEEKAITLYMSREGSKVHPSRPIPSKKTDSQEDTPMHLAAKNALFKLFKMFIDYGGHPGTLNIRHENCAHAVCLQTSFPSKRADLLDLIYDWRSTRPDNTIDYVYIDQANIEGSTALHIAAYNGLLLCVRRLVERGASLTLGTLDDLTPCDMADRGDHIQLGTMLELACLYQYDTTTNDAMHSYQKHTKDNSHSGRILLDGVSVPLTGFIEFLSKAIKASAEMLSESAPRAEVLLNNYGWDLKLLKKEYTMSSEKVLTTARLQPRVKVHDEVTVASTVDAGISVEEVYLDPCFSTVASFTVTRENKKLTYTFNHMDGKATVRPLDYNPNSMDFERNMNIASTSHIQPHETEKCFMCGRMMLQPASLQNFLNGTVVEGQRRELPCGSGHKFCINCWSDHQLSAVKRDHNLGQLSCPSANCGELLDIQWAPVLLKKAELVNRLIAQRQRHVIEALNLRWCPIQNCGLLVHLPGPNLGLSGPMMNSMTTSPSITTGLSSTCIPCTQPAKAIICGNGHAFCLYCSKEAHSPCKCSDVSVWNEWLREESSSSTGISRANGGSGHNALASMMLYYSPQKSCGVCRQTMVKENGCNIVRCKTCRVKYCWMCMQPWSTHTNRNDSVLFCNRYHELNDTASSNALHEAAIEEKSDDIGVVHKKLKLQRFNRLLHYNYRHMTHGESMKLESQGRKVIEERIYNGLVASFEGDLEWLQGGRVSNPLAEKEKELEAYNAIRGLEGDAMLSISDYYVPREDAIDFLIDAFDELEKCRSFLKWTYPFIVLELDEKFANASSPARPNAYRPKEQLDEVRAEFDALQGSLEYYTEMLSDLVARSRIRSNKATIQAAYHSAKAKRLEFEQLIFNYYASHQPQSVEDDKAAGGQIVSANSSLTSWDSKEKDRHASPERRPIRRSSEEIQETDFDAVLRGISNLTSAKAPVVMTLSDSSDEDSTEAQSKPFMKPTLQQKPSSYFQAAVNPPPQPTISGTTQTKTRSFYRTNSAGNVVANIVASPEPPPPAPQPTSPAATAATGTSATAATATSATPATPTLATAPAASTAPPTPAASTVPPTSAAPVTPASPQAGAPPAVTAVLSSDSEDVHLFPVRATRSPTPPPIPAAMPTQTPSNTKGLFRVGSSLTQTMVNNTTTVERKKIVIQSLYTHSEPEPVPPPPPAPVESVAPPAPSTPPPPPYVPPVAVTETHKLYEVIREQPPPPAAPAPPSLPQYIIEQRLIAAKKDPDQEALEHAIMISKQEEDYGVNMYDALTDDDEPILEEFIAQGFTREEAILILFEEKVGITKSNTITPAMPTLHKLTPDAPMPVSLPPGFVITEEVERDIEALMRKGFTREQAIEVLVDRRQRFAESVQPGEPADNLLGRRNGSRESQTTLIRRGSSGASTSSMELASPYASPSNGARSSNQTSDDARISQLMSRGLTMDQALVLVQEERRSAAAAAAAATTTATTATVGSMSASSYHMSAYDDNASRSAFRDEDPEVAHLMSKGYTREQAQQVIAMGRSRRGSNRATDSRHNLNEREEDNYSIRGGGRDQGTAAMLGRMTMATTSSVPIPAPAPPAADIYGRNHGAGFAGLGGGGGGSVSGMLPVSHTQSPSYSTPPMNSVPVPVPMPVPVPVPVSAPVPAPVLPPPRGGLYRASVHNSYDQTAMPEEPPPYYAVNGGGIGDYLPPPRTAVAAGVGMAAGQANNIASHSRGTSNTDNMNAYAPTQASTSYYGSTVVGDYGDYLPPHTQLPPMPGPMLDNARNMLMQQQRTEFGVHMYETITPSDGPEIRRLMSEGYSEDDAIQMIFDSRYRHQGGNGRMPYHQPPNNANNASGGNLHHHHHHHHHNNSAIGGGNASNNQSMYAAQYGGGVPQGNGGPSHGASFTRGSPMTRESSMGANSQSTFDFHSADRGGGAGGNQESTPQRGLSRDSSNNRSFYNGSTGSGNQPHDNGKSKKKLVSRVSSMFNKDKVTIEGDPMSHAMKQSQMDAQRQPKPAKMKYKQSDVKQLKKMGFNEAMAVQALLENDNDVNAAANALMNA